MKDKNAILMVSLITSMSLLTLSNVKAEYAGFYGELTFPTTNFQARTTNASSTVTLEERGNGYKLLLGKNLTKYISLEGFYSDFGKVSLHGQSGDSFTLYDSDYSFVKAGDLRTTLSGIGVNASVNYDITGNFSIHGRAGLLNWRKDMTSSNTDAVISIAKTGSDPFYGAGLKYSITDKYAFTANYTSYKIDGADITSRSLGVQYNF